MSADASVASENGYIGALTAEIVAAYVSKNPIQASELPSLIRSVREALRSDETAAPVEPEIEKPTPAQIKKSITPDALISFIDGKPYKSMRRHLTTHGLTPETYRQRYGLDPSYPVVSASYSKQRSELARALGLGRPRAEAAAKQASKDPVKSKKV